MIHCPVCSSQGAEKYRSIDRVQYFSCLTCGSLFADPAFLKDVEAGSVSNYKNAYWESEIRAARQRSYGSSLQRVAETFFYSRIPISHFVDIGTGPGYLLDAAATALPDSADMFYGVELFPPEPQYRSTHPNYKLCSLGAIEQTFDAGVCIEVIEHLTPSMLDSLARQMASSSAPGALYLFNSGQPGYVINEDPDYLDPLGRGHIMSYSLAAAAQIFKPHGFSVIPLPGRQWAFLVEFQSERTRQSALEMLEARLWAPLPQNVTTLRDGSSGPLMYHIGLDSARCYLEHATVELRTSWALSLQAEVDTLKVQSAESVKVRSERNHRDLLQNNSTFLERARRWWHRHAA